MKEVIDRIYSSRTVRPYDRISPSSIFVIRLSTVSAPSIHAHFYRFNKSHPLRLRKIIFHHALNAQRTLLHRYPLTSYTIGFLKPGVLWSHCMGRYKMTLFWPLGRFNSSRVSCYISKCANLLMSKFASRHIPAHFSYKISMPYSHLRRSWCLV